MSWKTTLCGVLALIAAAITLVAIPILDQDPSTAPQWGAFVAAASTAAGLYFARDEDRRKDDAGIK